MAPESARAPEIDQPHTTRVHGPSDLYRQIVESAHEGIWIHDLSGYTTFANAKMAELLGYSIPEMYGTTLFDVLDETGKGQALEMLERERLCPLTEQVDCRYVRKDGSNVWCLVNRSPLLDDEGRHMGSINLVTDITERQRVDETLRRNSDLLAEAQRVGHLGSWSWEVPKDLIDWSDEIFLILGLTRTESQLTYQSFLDQVHPEDLDMVGGKVGGGVDGDPTFTYDCRVIRPSGEIRWIHVEGQTIKDSSGTVTDMRGTLLDVTAYKEAVQEVERTSARYQLLQRMATEANKDTGFEHVLRLAVQEIRRHARWPVGRAYLVEGDRPQLMLIPGSDDSTAGPHTTLPARVFATGQPAWMVPPECHHPGRQASADSMVWGAGFAFPVLVGHDVVAVLEFLSDHAAAVDETLIETCGQVGTQLTRVVERQRAADDLAAARDAAMESLRVKSEFLATMSHEIRTPMNGVIGLTNLLLDTELDERQRQYAEGVHISGEALLTVINDILDFSKLEAGKVELDYEDFEVRRIVEEVAALLAPAAYAKDVELLAYCLPEVPDVLVGDSGRIRQIVLNFVSNGVKFTAAGEVVTKVTAAPLSAGRVNLRFEVRDTGIGIPQESRARLFESFSQADASTTRRYGGTGLGLAISQRLVEAMGGSIGFDSELEIGSTFWFEIPLKIGTCAPGRSRTLLPDLLADLPVLVVDDNATNRMILESQLGSWGLRPDTVDSARAALVAMRAADSRGEPYGIVVLDMCMPDVDGLQLAEQVSADVELSGTRMIMLTSTSELDPVALGAAGVSEWLLKPVRSSDLYDRLLRLMAPQVKTEPVAPTSPHTFPAERLSMGRVLVVEDNPLNQLVAQGIVTSLGYSVDIVDNGAEALRAILNTSYAAVLMDCHMPVLDGFEATREIRRREGGGARIPVIAMTAGAMAEDRERCAAAGMDDFVSKPVTLEAVDAALAEWARPDGRDPAPPGLTSSGGAGRPAWDAEPALDLNRITQLRQLGSMGGTDLLGRVVGLFARDGATSLKAIRAAASGNEPEDLLKALHKLKGTSANMGANRVAALCRQLEEQTSEYADDITPTTLVTSRDLELLEAELAHANRAITKAV